MERVADVLRHKVPQFNTIRSHRCIYDALHQMHSENVDYLIVMEDERFAGIITEHGLAEKIAHRRDLEHATVKEFMTTYLPITTLNASLEHCMQLMDRYNMRHVAVYDEFEFKGVLCSHDLLKQLLLKRKSVFADERENYSPWTY